MIYIRHFVQSHLYMNVAELEIANQFYFYQIQYAFSMLFQITYNILYYFYYVKITIQFDAYNIHT